VNERADHAPVREATWLSALRARGAIVCGHFAGRIARFDSIFMRRFVLKNRLNLRLLLDRTSMVDQHVISGGWEQTQLDRLFSYVAHFTAATDKRYFLDIGAYWGLYALIARQQKWFSDIIAFEPDPLNRSQLCAQLALNALANEIEVRGVALCERSGTELFVTSQAHSTGNRAGVNLFRGGPDSVDASLPKVMVPTDRLDNQLQIQNSVVFMKVDVEGFEINALTGARELLSNNHVVMQVECFPPNQMALRALLGELGYRELGQVGSDFYFTNAPQMPSTG